MLNFINKADGMITNEEGITDKNTSSIFVCPVKVQKDSSIIYLAAKNEDDYDEDYDEEDEDDYYKDDSEDDFTDEEPDKNLIDEDFDFDEEDDDDLLDDDEEEIPYN